MDEPFSDMHHLRLVYDEFLAFFSHMKLSFDVSPQVFDIHGFRTEETEILIKIVVIRARCAC